MIEVNRQKVTKEDDYQRAMEKARLAKGALFLIDRGGSSFFILLKE